MTSSHRILVVENNADDRYTLHLAFTELSFTDQVKVFETGDDLLKYLHNLPNPDLYPSLLVIDYNMPGMNGGELLMRLKTDQSLRDIPVAIYSTGMQNIMSKLQTLGADYCFEKANLFGEVYALAEKLKNIVDGKEVVEEK